MEHRPRGEAIVVAPGAGDGGTAGEDGQGLPVDLLAHAIAVVDLDPFLCSEAHLGHDARGRRHACRQPGLAEHAVDQGRFAAVKLAQDQDAQRAVVQTLFEGGQRALNLQGLEAGGAAAQRGHVATQRRLEARQAQALAGCLVVPHHLPVLHRRGPPLATAP